LIKKNILNEVKSKKGFLIDEIYYRREDFNDEVVRRRGESDGFSH